MKKILQSFKATKSNELKRTKYVNVKVISFLNIKLNLFTLYLKRTEKNLILAFYVFVFSKYQAQAQAKQDRRWCDRPSGCRFFLFVECVR